MIPDFNFDSDVRADNINLEPDFSQSVGNNNQTVLTPYGDSPKDSVQLNPVENRFNEAEYLNGMFTPAPRPKEDLNRKKRLEAMAGATGVGKAMSVLGDAFALSQGAVIPKRNIQQQDPYVAQLMEDSAKFKDKMDEADYLDYINRIRTEENIGRAKASEQKSKDQRERHASEKETLAGRHEDKKKLDAEHYKTEQKQKEAALKESNRRFDITSTQAQDRIDNYGTKRTDDGYDVTVDTKNNSYGFSKSEFEKVRAAAYADIEKLQEYNKKLFDSEDVVEDGKLQQKYSLKKSTKDEDLVRSYLEMKEKQGPPETVTGKILERNSILGEKIKGENESNPPFFK